MCSIQGATNSRLPPGMPDLRTCLLNQKLQMLNCCLERKIARENAKFFSTEDSGDSDEEFFDANDDEVDRREYSLWDKPVGRLSKFGEMKLLKTGDPLYIPFTQDPVLKTEDQLEEDTDVLLKLGSDQEASELRARIMSASLLSDMESFKAANPGSVVEDFIRWYSPRDWIEEDNELDEFGQKKGHLSPRMQLEDNIWVEMWRNARPVPANRQKRLFDDTREAEKILQFLDFRTVGQIAELVVPILTHSAILRLIDELESLPTIPSEATARVSSLLKQGERITRDTKLQPKRFEAFAQDVAELEVRISQVNSLNYKLNPSGQEDEEVSRAIGDLVSGQEINIPEKDRSQVGSRIISMFADCQRLGSVPPSPSSSSSPPDDQPDALMPAPRREFVLRANCVRPNLYSARCPQFLRVILDKREFRLVGAFSEDTAFF
ncbi:LOW QUALITY PROTEIN: rab3 GTPase-activating protein catalytic subunit-like [Sitophilus oryzae]|uniref:Rab3 GTPase-activating protein catalytic subunit n=1 Tax=Sitophilus oryzae TaxID=7048 RepID=A0A6J2Y3I6_SITOR|nr:LOW QUALITY PROTEIN: rab3 GTPase-activating protein catalytic subunit-like [Sitophilus oryzae]